MEQRELTVTGTFRYAHTWPAAIDLATTAGIAPWSPATSPLEETEAALLAGSDPAHIKAVITV
ncbi:hypothetical protein [Streptomyces hoynatensis]|uniref:Alcohol dehydrogenase n=1 Tax=Streptomyces hoynatensis TaxID=1141874 RepID=A0A3A9YMK2_9ACTN|nr:hypothetical protein [Streptomyces hoynatensis]RKN37392.1 hypothetical protein D7294_28045 [Streptomyces hoynatensis]